VGECDELDVIIPGEQFLDETRERIVIVAGGRRRVVGGIIPEQDVAALKQAGVAAVYTPKDFDISKIMREVVELVEARSDVAASA